ncbi:MAG TPA: class I SAM-dependent methyltransferase [Solirubrobacterales bacterium]|nr:class I SAM-dependent methyltransferase [Solirubrobacterales bacterium]
MTDADVFDVAERQEHIAESRRRMPGPSYYKVLEWIHRAVEPANYLEIGIRKGMSLGAALEETKCVGVDPAPMVKREFPNTFIYALTSDAFFADEDVDEVMGGPVELAFIDGLHLFEQVVEDFRNVEAHSAAGSIALFHDTLPLDAVTAGRERVTDFYSGDVWKAVMAIRRLRPDLDMVTVPAAPTGLTLVRGLDPGDRLIAERTDEIVGEYMELPFSYFEANRADMPPEIPNTEEAVRDWLARSPAPAA